VAAEAAVAVKEATVAEAVTAEVMYVVVGSAGVVIESVLIMEEQVALVEMAEMEAQVGDIDGMETMPSQNTLVLRIEEAVTAVAVQAVTVEEAELEELAVQAELGQTTMVLPNGQLVRVPVVMVVKLVVMVLALKQVVEGIQAVSQENLAEAEAQGEMVKRNSQSVVAVA
jgi:hypothetical protein